MAAREESNPWSGLSTRHIPVTSLDALVTGQWTDNLLVGLTVSDLCMIIYSDCYDLT